FFCVGRLSPEKGFLHVVQAARLLRQRGLNRFDVFLGGDGGLRGSLERSVREWGLSGHCHFLGWLSPAEVLEQMRACDAYVLPSLAETFGIVVAEAMACGKPVIATRCGGPESFVTPESGTLVPPAAPPALADAMQQFMAQRFKHDPVRIRQTIVD